jgi:hypothetical protein
MHAETNMTNEFSAWQLLLDVLLRPLQNVLRLMQGVMFTWFRSGSCG